MSNLSINSVMAMRSKILDRNAAFRNIASTAGPTSIGTPTFDAAMNSALQRNNGPGAIGDGKIARSISMVGETQSAGIAATFQEQLQKLNEINAKAGALTVAYERGEETDVAKVMLARQRSSIGFEATLQIRNKVLAAYKEIMSMAV